LYVPINLKTNLNKNNPFSKCQQMTQVVPAISGHSGPHFDIGFWAGVQQKKDNQPLKGSLGVFWHVFRDLHTLVPANLKKLESGDLKPDTTEGLKKVLRETFSLGAAAAKGLAEYYKWATDPGQTLFFVKKGTKCQWLVRKTGPYYYEEKPADPLWYPHRVPFEFVRAATEEEGVKRLGIGMNTMIWIPYSVSEPKIPLKNTVEMPPKKKVEPIVNTVVTPVVTPVVAKEKPKRTRKKPEPKLKVEPTHIPIPIPVIISPTPTPTYVEAIQEPLVVEETVIVKIKVFEHDGTLYFRDPVKNKLYTFKSPTSVGPYIGRWCPHTLAIVTDVPDSDSED
jgi:hypothetical protein